MQKQVFSPLYGLNTHQNYLTGRTADSLLDCVNVILRRAGVLQSRKGHPVLYSSGTYGSGYEATSSTRAWVGITEAPNQNIVIPWQISNSSTSGLVIYDGSSISTWDSLQETTNGGSSYTAATFDPQFIWPTDKELVWSYPRQLSSRDNHIITSAAGLVTSTSTDYNSYVWSIVPVVSTFDNITIQSGTIEQRWWNTGNKVNFRAVVEYTRADGIKTRSRPSHYEEITNLTNHGYARVGSVILFTENIVDYDQAVLKVYRTVQYDPITPAPADYYLCYEETLSEGSAGTSTVTFSNIDLFLNDDAIISQELIYTGFGSESGATIEEVNRTSTVPAARDAVEFKGYTFYGNVYRAPFAKLTMLTYPSFGTPSITVGGTSVNLVDFSNDALGDMPATGLYTEQQLTFEGLDTTARTIGIRAVDPNTAGGDGTPFYASVTDSVATTSSTGLTNLRLTPSTIFDADKFKSPGIACLTVTSGVNEDSITNIFTYRDFQYSATGNYVEFTGAVLQGTGGSWDTFSSSLRYLWFIPGISVDNLPIYNSFSTTTGNRVCLLPNYSNYPTQKFMPFPIGRISKMNTTGSAFIDLFGVYKRSEIKKLDDVMKEFAKDYNANRGESDPIAYHIRGSEPGAVFFELNRAGTSGYNTLYDSITASHSGTGTFSPDISSSSNIVTEDPHVRNGIVISKLGNPEEVSFEQTSAPIKIGKDSKKILRMAATSDELYIFKEDGIFRINIVEGTKNPVVSSVQPVDLTTFLIAPESVQVIEENIYFLSNRGVCILRNNFVTVIDSSIQGDVRNLYTKVRKDTSLGSTEDRRLSKIQSFGSSIQKIYGILFPRVATTTKADVTYLFNTETGQWTKSDHQFTSALVREDGRLTTIDTVYPYTTTPTTTSEINSAVRDYTATKYWSFLREDVLTSGFEDDLDQYDEVINLTAATITSPASQQLKIERNTASPSTVDYNIEDLPMRIQNRDLWYYFSADSAYEKATIASLNSTSITLSFEDDISSFTTSTDDKLYVGVTVDIKFNRFYPSLSYTDIQFQQASFFDIGQYDGVILSFGNDMSTDFDQPSDNDVVSGVWRAYVPDNASRGTHLISRIQHSKPLETFQIAGHAVTFDDTQSEAVGRNNC